MIPRVTIIVTLKAPKLIEAMFFCVFVEFLS